MIRLLHNQMEKELDLSLCANLAEAVEYCTSAERAQDGPQVVMAVRVNGCAVPEERLGELEGYPLDAIEELEIDSRSSREVAISSLDHSAGYAGQIFSVLERAVGHFRAGRIDPANQLCADLADSIGVLVAALDAARKALEPQAEGIRQFSPELLPWLETLVEAQSDCDWVRVADYLEFEIAPLVQRWERNIRRLHGEIEGGSSRDGS